MAITFQFFLAHQKMSLGQEYLIVAGFFIKRSHLEEKKQR